MKNYSGNTFVGTTKDTTYSEVELQQKYANGSNLLSSHEEEIVVDQFLFVDRVNQFLKCQIKSCNKKMPYSVGANVFKCEGCGTTQKVKLAEKGMSARLCVIDEGNNLWLTALNDEMEKLTSAAGIKENSTTDDIAAALLQLENIKIKYDKRSKFILQVD